MSRVLPAFLLVLCAGCAPSVEGSLAGREVRLVNAIQGKFTGDNGIAWLFVSDSPDPCGDLKAHRKRPGGTLLFIALARRSGDNNFAGTLAATYPVVAKGVEAPQGPYTRPGLFAWDDGCTNLAKETLASSGEVVLDDDLTPGRTASGHLDVTFPDGSHAAGTFTAESCDGLLPLDGCG